MPTGITGLILYILEEGQLFRCDRESRLGLLLIRAKGKELIPDALPEAALGRDVQIQLQRYTLLFVYQ